MTDRRGFLGLMGAGATLPFLPELAGAQLPTPVTADWDMTWLGSITGKHRAVFDTPTLDAGIPLLRACIWGPQWREVYGEGETTSAVLVLRAGGFAYAMNDAAWDRFEVARTTNLSLYHGAPATPGNPVRAARSDVPERFRRFNIEPFMADGGVVLACNLTFSGQWVPRFQQAGNLTPEAAREEALRHLIPGVRLMPSGIWAVSCAQEAGCQHIHAS